MPIDPREFRDTLGRLPTGVTVITMRDRDDAFFGVTVGSFTSLSLDPPLVLFSLDRSANCFDAFKGSDGYVVNILAEDQSDLSNIFASKEDRPWHALEFDLSSEMRAPVFNGCVARIECKSEVVYPGGDHEIFVGRVVGMERLSLDGRPLLHFGGTYRRLDADAL